eukprot:Sdes_comp19997_c0_seq1m12631
MIEKNSENFFSTYDFFGFRISCEQSENSKENQLCFSKELKNEDQQDGSWEKILQHWDTLMASGSTKLSKLVKKGVPPNHRKNLWKNLLQCHALQAGTDFQYQPHRTAISHLWSDYLVKYKHKTPPKNRCQVAEAEKKAPDAIILSQIYADLDRTLPTHKYFEWPEDSPHEPPQGLVLLFHILTVYAIYNSQNGYCQGMSYLCAMLIITMTETMDIQEEEQIFWGLVSVIDREKYFRGYFDKNLSRIHKHAAIFEKLLEKKLPQLGIHLKRNQVAPLMYVTQWLMRLFTSLPRWDTVLYLWDILLTEGVESIFLISISIMAIAEKDLLELEGLGLIVSYLQNLPKEKFDCAEFKKTLMTIHIHKWELHAAANSLQAKHTDLVAEIPKEKQGLALAQEPTKPKTQQSKFKSFVESITTPIKITLKEKLYAGLAKGKPAEEEKFLKNASPKRQAELHPRRILEGRYKRFSPRTPRYSPYQRRKLQTSCNSRMGPQETPHREGSSPNIETKYGIFSSTKADQRINFHSPGEKLSFREFATPTPVRNNSITITELTMQDGSPFAEAIQCSPQLDVELRPLRLKNWEPAFV